MEIKFRAFNGKEMIKPYCVRNGKCCIIKECDRSEDSIWYGGSNYYKNWDIDVVTDYPLMQFTGLTDKTGKDIYEGDIIKGDSENYRVTFGSFGAGLVEVDGNSYNSGEYYEGSYSSTWEWDEFEVIGNIHLHPELMESDDE